MRFLVESTKAPCASRGARVLWRYSAFDLIECDRAPTDVTIYARLLSGPVNVNGHLVEIPAGFFEIGNASHVLVRFVGPLAPPWQMALWRRGIRVLFFCPGLGACLELPTGLLASELKEKFSFLDGARAFTSELYFRSVPEPTDSLPASVYDVVCLSPEQRRNVAESLRLKGIPLLATAKHKLRIHYDGDIGELRDIDGIKLIGRARLPRVAGGTLPLRVAPRSSRPAQDATNGLLGEGQIVAIADSGLDTGSLDDMHPDLRGRIRMLSSWPIHHSWSPYVDHPGDDDGAGDSHDGHGTHLAGVVLGDGASSGGKIRGIAPRAQLVFQSLEQFTQIRAEYAKGRPSGFYLSGKPLALDILLEEARQCGARIHLFAWGDRADGAYTDDSWEVDDYLWKRNDAIVVIAAGNSLETSKKTQKRDLWAPATSKNGLAIGALVTSPRAREDSFDGDAVGPAELSGLGETRIASFNARGPTADGRIKPDLYAPGVRVPGPRSRLLTWSGEAPHPPQYIYWSGTSVAAAHVAGAVAVIRARWKEKLEGNAPSGPALKALLVLGAKEPDPDSHEALGYGRIDLDASTGDIDHKNVRLHDALEPGLQSGDAVVYEIHSERIFDLKAVLTWYDIPAESLINDLDIFLELEDGTRIWGNHPAGKAGSPDRTNTVEVIEKTNLPAGSHRLHIYAFNVSQPPQGYALAVSLSPEANLGRPSHSWDRLTP